MMNFQPFPMMNQGLQTHELKSAFTLYVGDLEQQVTEEMLFRFFSQFGQISSVRIMKDKVSKISRGFAYVSFYNQTDAENARIKANHEKILQNSIRVVKYRSPKEFYHINADVFIKELDRSLTAREIEKYFERYGSIFSCKIAQDYQGNSLGYGYIQFDNKESAEKCLADNERENLGEKRVEVQVFQKKDQRGENKNNLYVKNLPELQENEITAMKEKIISKFEAYGQGKVTSAVVVMDKIKKKPYAFICFENHQTALKCLELNDTDCFGTGELLYVGWAQKLSERKKILQKGQQIPTNNTNLFTKFLKPSVTQEKLKETFQIFGEITSCIVRQPSSSKTPNEENTQFGFINFKEKSDAQDAFSKAKDNKEICNLYTKDQVYITYFMAKDVFTKYKITKQRKPKINQFGMPFGDPFSQGFPKGMGMPPFNFMMPRMPPMFNRPQNQAMNNKNKKKMPPFAPPMGQMPPMFNPMMMYPMNQMQGMPPMNLPPQNFNMMFPQQRQMPPKQQFQMPQQMYMQQQQPQQPIQPPQMPAQQQQQPSMAMFRQGLQSLKQNLNEFLKISQEQQRTLLGEYLFPLVKEICDSTETAPKITGMLIDFEVFEVQDILEFLENKEMLNERVQEALELINNPSQ